MFTDLRVICLHERLEAGLERTGVRETQLPHETFTAGSLARQRTHVNGTAIGTCIGIGKVYHAFSFLYSLRRNRELPK